MAFFGRKTNGHAADAAISEDEIAAADAKVAAAERRHQASLAAVATAIAGRRESRVGLEAARRQADYLRRERDRRAMLAEIEPGLLAEIADLERQVDAKAAEVRAATSAWIEAVRDSGKIQHDQSMAPLGMVFGNIVPADNSAAAVARDRVPELLQERLSREGEWERLNARLNNLEAHRSRLLTDGVYRSRLAAERQAEAAREQAIDARIAKTVERIVGRAN